MSVTSGNSTGVTKSLTSIDLELLTLCEMHIYDVINTELFLSDASSSGHTGTR